MEWSQEYAIDFSTLANQDLKVSPTFGTHFTAAHTANAVSYDIVNGTGIVCQANNGTTFSTNQQSGPFASVSLTYEIRRMDG